MLERWYRWVREKKEREGVVVGISWRVCLCVCVWGGGGKGVK